MIKYIPVLFVLAFLCSCEEKANSGDSTDSTKMQVQKPMSQSDSLAMLLNQHSKDTTHLYALPPVFDGDIVFQNDSVNGKYMQEAAKGKYNHCGMIFKRERDHQYMVIEAYDSVHTTPLQEWVDRGKGDHMAIYRMKNANTMMTKERTQKIRMACRRYKKLPYDYYFNWSDSAMYSSEFVWKVYHDGTGYRVGEPTTLDSLDLTGADVKKKIAERYGKNIPKKEQVITPDRIMGSPLFERVYEQ